MQVWLRMAYSIKNGLGMLSKMHEQEPSSYKLRGAIMAEFNIVNGIIYIFICILVIGTLFVIKDILSGIEIIDKIFIVAVFGMCAFIFVIIVLIIAELRN